MEARTEIKKDDEGIEKVLGGYRGQKVDEMQSITVEGCADFKRILEKYERVLKDARWLDRGIREAVEQNRIDDILAPHAINAFLQITARYEEDEEYTSNTGLYAQVIHDAHITRRMAECTGRFINRLIQNSYNAGHNGFHLNTTALKEVFLLGAGIEGTEESPIQIKITGNAGVECGWGARVSTFNIEGNAEYGCGHNAARCTFNIQGDAGDWCGESAKHSEFNIKGNAGSQMGQFAEFSTFNIEGNIGELGRIGLALYAPDLGQWIGRLKYEDGNGAVYSTFRTQNKEALKQLLRGVRKWKRNRIIYVTPEGEEKPVRWRRAWKHRLRE